MIVTANRQFGDDNVATRPDVVAGDYVMIEVTDTGLGMSAEVVRQIYQPYFTTKDAGKGTELGLAMVFGFVRQSNGYIDVYSEPDQGTTFRIFLPRAPETENAEPVAPTPTFEATGAGETILVVEDNPALSGIVVRQIAGARFPGPGRAQRAHRSRGA